MIGSTVQNFLSYIIIFASNIAMLILLIRFVAAPFLYAGQGPFMQAINQAAMAMSRPFSGLCFRLGFRRRDVSPLAAIVTILIGRGILFTVIPVSFDRTQLTARLFLLGQQQSLELGAFSLLRVIGVLLFAAVMFTKAGGFFSGVFFRTVDDLAGSFFSKVKAVVHTGNLWILLFCSYAGVCIVFALAVCLIRWNLYFPYYWAMGMLEIAGLLLWLMMILIFIYIIVGWLSILLQYDFEGKPWLVLRAMVAPAMNRCRAMFPWARIGLLDLSPIFLIFALYFGQMLIAAVQGMLMQSLTTSNYVIM